jgi:hypothetical protein
MTALKPNDRPNCEVILERKRHWGLEPTQLNDNPFVKSFAQKCLEMESLENFFITRFIIFKFKYLMKDFGIPKLDLKTFFEPKVVPQMNEQTGVVSMLAKNFKKLFNSEK